MSASIDKRLGLANNRGHAIATASKVRPDGKKLPPGELLPAYEPVSADAQQWNGWGTALKPATELICLARKPLSEPSVAANVLRWGTGALNVDAGRVGTTVESWPISRSYGPGQMQPGGRGETQRLGVSPPGRWPANVILDEHAAEEMDRQSGESKSNGYRDHRGEHHTGAPRQVRESLRDDISVSPCDSGGASRFFYIAKASPSERHAAGVNAHPTVKPIALMTYLVALVCPPAGTVLDPFAGSGSTGIAAARKNFSFVGIEQDYEYVKIAARRIEADAPMFNHVQVEASK